MNTAKSAIVALIGLWMPLSGGIYTLNNGNGASASGISTATGATFRSGTVAGTPFTGANGGVSAGPGVIAMGIFDSDVLPGGVSPASFLAGFTQFGAVGSFSPTGVYGNRSIFSLTNNVPVAGSVFENKNIYLVVGDGTTLLGSMEFLVLKTDSRFTAQQDASGTAMVITVRPYTNTTVLCGSLAGNVWTTNSDTTQSMGWFMGWLDWAPTNAVTTAASGIMADSATLNGSISSCYMTSWHFEYGLSETYGSTTSPGEALNRAVNVVVGGLTPGATYHYRLVGNNVDGTVWGNDMTFTTYLRLTTVSANGMVSGAGLYQPNTTASLTATAAPGYVFVGWSGDVSGNENPRAVFMDGEKTVTANFGPDSRDDDGDGLTNYQEAVELGTDPGRADSDGDGLPDWDELNIHGTLATARDSDGDGFLDGYEVLLGRSPLEQLDKPAFVAQLHGALELAFPSALGKTYQIEAAPDLTTWQAVESGIPGNGSVTRRSYATGQSPQRFFRVREE